VRFSWVKDWKLANVMIKKEESYFGTGWFIEILRRSILRDATPDVGI
jgi:hypothetical protein